MKVASKWLCLVPVVVAVAAYSVGKIVVKKDREQIVALVSYIPISKSQLDRALNQQQWLKGKSDRETALNELIDHELLRTQVDVASPPITVTDAEINEHLRRFIGKFENKGALESAMQSQGLPHEAALREHITARIKQDKFIAQKIASEIQVTDEEARAWFAKNHAAVALPPRIQVRHIFLPTLDHPADEAELKLKEALTRLTSQQTDFATLTKELSEDPATKDSGGELGWMTRDRLPQDFADPLFSMPEKMPQLMRTKLGWHIVEVTNRLPAEPRNYDAARLEIFAALEAIKRRDAVTNFREDLRAAAASEIEIY